MACAKALSFGEQTLGSLFLTLGGPAEGLVGFHEISILHLSARGGASPEARSGEGGPLCPRPLCPLAPGTRGLSHRAQRVAETHPCGQPWGPSPPTYDPGAAPFQALPENQVYTT